MTPQYRGSRNNILQKFDAPAEPSGPGRYSLGGGEAKRVVIQQPWKVRDLVLPAAPFTESRPLMPIDPPDSVALSGTHPSRQMATPMKPPVTTSGTPSHIRPLVSVSEEERKNIRERRRSAVKVLSDNSFWAGGAPGMSPAKSTTASSNLLDSPKKLFESAVPSSLTQTPESRSPTKGRSLTYAIAEDDENKNDQSVEDDDLDTHGLLEKMRETVSDMKRRRSVVLSGNAGLISTPQRVAIAPTALMTSMSNGGDIKKIDLTKIAMPSRLSLGAPTPKSLARTNTSWREESDEVVQEEFSLLRPGAVHAMNRTPPTLQAQESSTAVPLSLPVIVADLGAEDELSVEPTHVQPRLSSVTQPREETNQDINIETEHDVDNETEVCILVHINLFLTRTVSPVQATALKSTANAILTRRQRSRTPQPSLVAEGQEGVHCRCQSFITISHISSWRIYAYT